VNPIFVAFRRTLPGGATVLISMEQEPGGNVHGRLQVERRRDEMRRDGHDAPVVAESRAATQQEALALLMTVAGDDAEVARRMAEWQAMREEMRRTTPPGAHDAV
jgi:hypothetical protein